MPAVHVLIDVTSYVARLSSSGGSVSGSVGGTGAGSGGEGAPGACRHEGRNGDSHLSNNDQCMENNK